MLHCIHRVHIGTEKNGGTALQPLSAGAEGKIASQSIHSLDGVCAGGTSQGVLLNWTGGSGDGWEDCCCSCRTPIALDDCIAVSEPRLGSGAGVWTCDARSLIVDVSLDRRADSGGTNRFDGSNELSRSYSHLRMISATCRRSCCSTGPGCWLAVLKSSCCTLLSSSRRNLRESSLGASLS
jgi:hypothetical protein